MFKKQLVNNGVRFYCAFFAFIFLGSFALKGQDELMADLMKEIPEEKEPVFATFKGTRLINLQTVEIPGKNTLEFRIAHRFGDFSSGGSNLWGLDGPATIQFHFDYGITDRLAVGVGRASYNKMFDTFVKYKLLRQTADNSTPLSLTILGSTNVTALGDPAKKITGVDRYQNFNNRVAYVAQILLARKFSSKLSLQVAPKFIHFNLTRFIGEQNDHFALGFSGRYKLTSHAAFTSEYIYRINKQSPYSDQFSNVLSLGFDLETGGHVFQVFVTKSLAINEVTVVPYTESRWSKNQIRLGFNISRVFSMGRKSKKDFPE